jgi:pimeloyl-ACP methyl ester carboxylesterase
MIFGLLLAAAAVLGTPCTTVSLDCTEWMKPAGQQSRVLIYRNYPLEAKNENITRALVFVHGINRDADNHFRTVLAAAFLAGALNNTIIVSPRFASNSTAPGNQIGDCHDALAPDEANWICETQRADSWRSGGGEVGNDKLTSFDFMDEIVRRLARKDVFPNLKNIVVAGHSAGGQFVIRYEMANQVHDSVRVPISYVVSNPSTYPYVDDLRPTSTALPTTIAAAAPGFMPAAPAVPPPAFVPYADAQNCAGYDNWPYGLKRRVGYASRITDDDLKKQLAARRVTYLLGETDILPLGIFDASCSAMAQGPTRLARGLAFSRYVKEHNGGANHNTVVVPFCGHSARCVFTSDMALPLIFPN